MVCQGGSVNRVGIGGPGSTKSASCPLRSIRGRDPETRGKPRVDGHCPQGVVQGIAWFGPCSWDGVLRDATYALHVQQTELRAIPGYPGGRDTRAPGFDGIGHATH